MPIPSWLVSLVLKFLADNITPEMVKGVEAELVCILEKALAKYPAAVALIEILRKDLGLPPCPVAAPAAAG